MSDFRKFNSNWTHFMITGRPWWARLANEWNPVLVGIKPRNKMLINQKLISFFDALDTHTQPACCTGGTGMDIEKRAFPQKWPIIVLL